MKKVSSESIRSKLFQWRLLFYFQEFQVHTLIFNYLSGNLNSNFAKEVYIWEAVPADKAV